MYMHFLYFALSTSHQRTDTYFLTFKLGRATPQKNSRPARTVISPPSRASSLLPTLCDEDDGERLPHTRLRALGYPPPYDPSPVASPPLSFFFHPSFLFPLPFLSFSFLLIRFVSTFVSNFTSPGSRQTQTRLTLTSPSRSTRIRVCLSVSTPRRYCRIRPLWRLAAFSSTSPPYGCIPAPFFQVTNEFLYLVGVAF